MKKLTWVKENGIRDLYYSSYYEYAINKCIRSGFKGWDLYIKKAGKLRLLSNHETLKLAKEAATK